MIIIKEKPLYQFSSPLNYRSLHDNKHFKTQKLEHGEKTKIILAALTHDLGHIAFSHGIEPALHSIGITDFSHEAFSLKFLEKILEDSPHDFDFQSKEFEYLMNGSCSDSAVQSRLSKNGLFSIVSDHVNGIDSDRLDYIRRDCHTAEFDFHFDPFRIISSMQFLGSYNGRSNHIGFSLDQFESLNNFFEMRYRLYRVMYLSDFEMGYELFLADLLTTFHEKLDLKGMLTDFEKVPLLTDTYVQQSLTNIYKNRDSLSLNKTEMELIERYWTATGYDCAGAIRVKVRKNGTKSEMKERCRQIKQQVIDLVKSKVDSDQVVFDIFAKSPFKDSNHENMGNH